MPGLETESRSWISVIRPELSDTDSRFLAYLRGIAILVIVFGQVGGFWCFKPYSEFLLVFLPVFFFLSGAVSYYSYRRSPSVREYLKKRVLGLLVPYYLACLLVLAVYVVTSGSVPAFSAREMFMWLAVRPVGEAQGFPLSGMWFLRALLVISLVSPIYFWLWERKPWLLVCLMWVFLGLATVELFHDVHGLFVVAENNLYQPIGYGIFYVFGFAYFSTDAMRRELVLVGFVAAGLLLSVGLVAVLGLNPDYGYHRYSPDLYYVSGSLAAIAGLPFLFSHENRESCEVRGSQAEGEWNIVVALT